MRYITTESVSKNAPHLGLPRPRRPTLPVQRALAIDPAADAHVDVRLRARSAKACSMRRCSVEQRHRVPAATKPTRNPSPHPRNQRHGPQQLGHTRRRSIMSRDPQQYLDSAANPTSPRQDPSARRLRVFSVSPTLSDRRARRDPASSLNDTIVVRARSTKGLSQRPPRRDDPDSSVGLTSGAWLRSSLQVSWHRFSCDTER